MALDPEFLVEALIVEGLEALPKRRHPDWIRNLLVQGFLAERRIVRRLDGTATAGSNPRPGTPSSPPSPRRGFVFAGGFGQVPKPRPAAPTQDPASPAAPSRPSAPKPFAHLRKVVG